MPEIPALGDVFKFVGLPGELNGDEDEDHEPCFLVIEGISSSGNLQLRTEDVNKDYLGVTSTPLTEALAMVEAGIWKKHLE